MSVKLRRAVDTWPEDIAAAVNLQSRILLLIDPTTSTHILATAGVTLCPSTYLAGALS
jgi:hypothetical protein